MRTVRWVVLWLLTTGSATAGSVQDCDRQLADQGPSRTTLRCYYLAARSDGVWEEAEQRLGVLSDTPGAEGWARLSLGFIHSDLGRDDQAVAILEEALARFRQAGSAEGEVYARLGLSTISMYSNDFEAVEEQMLLAAERAATLEDPVPGAMVQLQRARALSRDHQPQRALDLLPEVEAALFPDGPYQGRMAFLYVRGRSQESLGLTEAAYASYLQMGDLTRAAGDLYAQGSALGLAASLVTRDPTLVERLGRDELERLAVEALQVGEQSGNAPTALEARCLLGMVRAAEADLRVCQAQRGPEDHWRPDTAVRLALLRAREDPDAGLALAAEAVREAHTPEALVLYRVLMMSSWLAWEHGHRERALAESVELLDVAEARRDREWSELGRARVQGVHAPPTQHLVGRLLRGDPSRADLELAFATMERGRANLLLEALSLARVVPATSPAREQLHRRRAELSALYRDTSDLQQEVALAEAALARAEAEVRREEAELAGASPASVVELGELQEALAPDQALVSYQLGAVVPEITWLHPGWRADSLALVVTHELVRVVPLPDAERLEQAVAMAEGLVHQRDGSEVPALRALHRLLVEGVLDGLPSEVERLVIVPDGALHQVPWAALAPDPGDPLVAEYALSLAPSATLWMSLRRQRPAGQGVLALADPPTPEVPLRAARSEARRAVRRGGGRLLLGAQATEEALGAADLDRFSVIHLATHAQVDPASPTRSSILLAPGRGDGRLRVGEITELGLRGQVVVLSACASGSGEVVLGEGVLGLARGFFQAGAAAVVATLWPMGDREAAALFAGLYHHLGRGDSVERALARAQARAASRGVPAQGWAGAVVLGAGEIRPLPERRTSWPWVVLALVAAAGGIGLRWRRGGG